MDNEPINLVNRRIEKLMSIRQKLSSEYFSTKVTPIRMADIAEIDMEVQRLQFGWKPNPLKKVLPPDRFWRRMEFNTD